jgi:hypothetical protein
MIVDSWREFNTREPAPWESLRVIYRMLGNESFDREEVARTYREATIR